MGASKDALPLFWLAAPLTGLLVQPIIGYMSDRTWHPRLGRRRPYFLVGALLASAVLIFVPHSPALWIAAGCLWMLDASINISMEPFRALVADKLPDSQRSYGFVVQTFIIGIGTWIASNLPWFISKLGISNEALPGVVPANVKWAFAVGGVVFLLSILYTILTTKEYPPEDMDAFLREKEKSKGFFNGIKIISENIFNMPRTMARLGVVQFFSWFAFFTMWSMATPALTEHVFNSPKPEEADFMSGGVLAQPEAYQKAETAFNVASDLVGSAMGVYGLSSMVFALLLTIYTSRSTINRKYLHMGSLIAGGLGFLLMNYTNSYGMLAVCFVLIGISWGSILSMPYAMLSSSVDPQKMGVIMGIFNMFIVIPQIVASIGGINLMSSVVNKGAISAMIVAGISLILAGLANFLITNPRAIRYRAEDFE